MTRDRLPFLLIPLAALLVILPLLLRGPSCGHDLNFHLLSWQEAARSFAAGDPHPRWAITPAFNAGEPRFIFYPPLSWTLGALLTLAAAALAATFHLAPAPVFALTPVLYIWLALTLAGLAMLRLARRFVSPAAATLAATLYLANPYTLFTAYERSAFAELLAAALLPLLLSALLPLFDRQLTHLSIPAVALPLSLLWLANAPSAVIGSYTLALLILLRLLLLWRRPAAAALALPLCLRAIAAATLGLSLAAFYIVPAASERRWVQISMAVLAGLRPDDNTLFHHTPDAAHDAVLHTASLLAILLLSLTLLASTFILSRRPKPLPDRHFAAVLLTLASLIALLLTPLSLPLWHHLPELAFLQFPWRLLALLAPVCALALAVALRNLHLRPAPLAFAALLLPAAIILPAVHTFRQTCDLDDTPQARFLLFHAASTNPAASPAADPAANQEPTDEYTPIDADNDALHPGNPPVRVLDPTAPDDLPAPSGLPSGPAPRSLTLTLLAPARVVFNLRAYPTWRILVNGRVDQDRIARNDGLLTLALPAGTAHIVLEQHTPPLERAADALSLFALAILAPLVIRRRRRLAL